MTWKTVRDRTAVALMLGAGLAPGDVRSLQMDGVITAAAGAPAYRGNWRSQATGNSPARETPIADWAGRQLAFWLRIRAQQGMPGNYVFPIDDEWHAVVAHALLRSQPRRARCSPAGQDSGGLFKLRHTFALRQLRKGKSEEDVARWLGLLDVSSMTRYRRIVSTYQDLV